MSTIITTPSLLANGLGLLKSSGEKINIHPRKCHHSGKGLSKGYLVGYETIAEDQVDNYCVAQYGITWDEHIHTIDGVFIPREEREDYLSDNDMEDFTDDANYYTEWDLESEATDSGIVYDDSGKGYDVEIQHDDTVYLFITLAVQDGEREHTHRCLTSFDITEDDVRTNVEDYVSEFWGDSEKIRDGQYEAWHGEIIITLKGYRLLTTDEHELISELFSNTI